MQPRLAVSIIAHNEARELRACLASVRHLADELIVVDCASRDGTAQVAKRAGARVFRRPNLANLNQNKSFGISKARAPWVLYLDPDERITTTLRREILRIIRRPEAADAYEMPRRNYYFGRWLRWGGKYPDLQRRLFRRGRARLPGKHVHERLTVAGPVSRLAAPLEHHPYPDMEAFFHKLDFYSRFQAHYLWQRGTRATPIVALQYLFWLPGTRFIRRFFFKAGFLDGLPGYLACVHDTLTHILTYAHLRDLGSKKFQVSNSKFRVHRFGT